MIYLGLFFFYFSLFWCFFLNGLILDNKILCENKSTNIQKSNGALIELNSSNFEKHIISITIPKTGTHLLYKCLLLLQLKGVYHPEKKGLSEMKIEKIRKLNFYFPPNHYKGFFHIPTVGPIPKEEVRLMSESQSTCSILTHWPYTDESAEIFNFYGKANFLMMRDPRDQLVSMAFMIYKNKNGLEAPFETVLKDLIDGTQRLYVPWAVEIQTAHPLMWELGVVNFYELYLPWMDCDKFLTIKFENLVGVHGGGSLECQMQEIRNIAHHIGVQISNEDVLKISLALFGETLTFREGKIGNWKYYFNEEIKDLYKQVPGACELLIKLGYETSDKW